MVNKVILLGNLGQNPEYKELDNGNKVAKFSIATSERYKDKNTGETKSKTEWHNVVIWGKLAEVANQYLSKGSQLYVEGKLTHRKYQDKDGNERYTTEVVANNFQMLGKKETIATGSNPTTSPIGRPVVVGDGMKTPTEEDMPF